MPEGPELHLASVFINKVCAGQKFAGKVEKSAVSKNPEVPFSCPHYTISAGSRGKEIRLLLSPTSDKDDAAYIVFRFGMSGSFKFTTEDELPKHAHLRFYTRDVPRHVLSFVDPRRFGSWEFNGSWQPERGPCVMTEYEKFRANVLNNLSDKAFDKPICEALLNQKYFNGIGNYLRAEILFRSQTPPFAQARAVLEALKHHNQNNDLPLSKKIKIKKENPDLLQLCNLVPMEVMDLGSTIYDAGNAENYSAFATWLQCYMVPGMKQMKDSNGRTIWFQGDPGSLAPKGGKGKGKRRKSLNVDHKSVKVEKNVRKRKAAQETSTTTKKVKKEELKTELGLETTKRRRATKVENAVDKTIKTEGELTKRVQNRKKSGLVAEGRKGRTTSPQGSAVKSPPTRGRGKLQNMEETANLKSRPRRLKSDMSLPPINSPKPRRLKSDLNPSSRSSPKLNTRLRRKITVPESEKP